MHGVGGLAIEHRQLHDVGIGDEAGQHPGAGHRHLDAALAQRLGHVGVLEELAAVEELGLDAAARFLLHLLQIAEVSSEARNLTGS